MTPAISPNRFPTPDLALRSTDPAELQRVRGFAVEQAHAANDLRAQLLDRGWLGQPARARARSLCEAHAWLVRWRYELASRAPHRLGVGIALNAERFRADLDEYGPNYDRIGYTGRFRAGATWDGATRTFRGGQETPAHRVMLAYGRAVAQRFARLGVAGDVLANTVVLPDATRLTGNRLIRGEEAARATEMLFDRLVRRGADTGQIETGGEPFYAVSASSGARAEIFRAALDLLARAEPGEVAAWQQARYLLYQAPRTKKGSDAVTRTFLVAVGAILLGAAPTLEQDVDLRCMLLGQDRATVMPGDPA